MPALTTHPPRDSVVPEVPPRPTTEAAAGDPQPAAKPFYIPIDPLRGWVCLSIILMHFLTSEAAGPLVRSLGGWFSFAVAHVRFGYETFFVISGFFFART